MVTNSRFSDTQYARIALLVLGGLLLVRVLALLTSPLNLYADEAQYWRWGETLEWGYYSKPPMIAWVIHLFTAIFGNDPWAIRLASPLLHTASGLLLYLLGQRMYDARTGMFAAIGYALMPAVTLSAGLISTDGVLLPFWCLALYSYWRLREGAGSWASAAGLGLGLGLGFLSKYAMIYFPIGIALTLLIDTESRRCLFSLRGALALAIAAAIFAPHLMWNAANAFQTVSHTVDNANLGGDLINPEHAVTFIVDQMGVFGPISFLALVVGSFIMMRAGDMDVMGRDRWLLCFIAPVLVIILVQAVLSRANANWAATAYPAASVLVAAWLTRARANKPLWWIVAGLTFVALMLAPDINWMTRLIIAVFVALGILSFSIWMKYRPSGLLWVSMGLHGLVAVFLLTVSVMPAEKTQGLGLDNALKRTRGWPEMTERIFSNAKDVNATAILVDEREVWHALDYYARDRDLPLISWRRYDVPKSFSEKEPLTDAVDARVLIVSLHPGNRPRLRSDFASMEDLGEVQIFLGKRGNGCPILRTVHLYLASDFTPQARTPEWEAAFDGKMEFPNQPCNR